ncbi:hypothetical protein LPJ66_000580 [Kickxella alabastrina]|uniref:Uncharacterized protein n=1 Tax=Kickxella alabastrina TaxID=61397 RepID=A0ACC1IVS6_9FUNG|nr:hypothetical protein LPJ66_000580 [Kickxella alabastrina]
MHRALYHVDVLSQIFLTYYKEGWEMMTSAFETNYMRGLHPLAAVCKTWRGVAYHHFLAKCMSIEVFQPPDHGRRGEYFKSAFEQEACTTMGPFGYVCTPLTRSIYHSNAYLIPHTGNKTTTFYLYLGNNVTAMDIVHCLNCIEFAEYEWPLVTALHIVTDTMYIPGPTNEDDIRRPLYHSLNAIAPVIEWLFGAAPRIDSVMLGSRSKFVYPGQLPLQGAIFDNIARLKKLEISSQFSSFTIPPVLPPLTALSICPVHFTHHFLLAKLSAEHLQKLSLHHIQPRHFFKTIGISGPQSPTVFPELRSLGLYFSVPRISQDASSNWYNSHEHNLVRFPKLRLVTIYNYYYNISGIFRALLQSPVENLRISTQPSLFVSAEIHRFMSIKKLWANFEMRQDQQQLLAGNYFDRLFSSQTPLTDMSICLPSSDWHTSMTSIESKLLYTLDLDLKLGYAQAMSIMSGLPRLVHFRCVIDTMSVDNNASMRDILCQSHPICSTTVEHMVLVFHPQAESVDISGRYAVLAHMLSLIARVPSLLHLRSSYSAATFRMHVRRALAINEFATIGRHLKNIKYTARANSSSNVVFS